MTRTLYTNVNLKAKPIHDEHLVNKKYVDKMINKKVVDPVRVATDGECIDFDNLPDPLVIDGVTVGVGDRVLLTNQTAPDSDPTKNGIYVLEDDGAGNKTLVRAENFEDGEELPPNMMIPVMEGKANGDVTFVSTNDSKATIGNDPLNFGRLKGEEYSTANKFEFAGNDTDTDFVILHNLGTELVQVAVYDKTTKEECQFDVKVIDDKSVNIHADIVLTPADEFIVVVIG